ncbi:hypothetical protein PHYBLDRAFT_158983 [Phycomyces blakesleeanus NRRL 1555(-)]|uniref:Uncharacterized protein n=2 Tax=Phycomyces blakesleeanus TaxID=4837 RepID=A0A167MG66_PHYB8|nr:hypothetical protein PHYBLDRAFT_158983 [Phycomyces blakesleeanus NRRL 1555(-)]OAD72759.1 hypothetical protein PHYBLDRAFT_158983 [Phycomyces blakesleeanus NRRL 1555(-)]|eukprot:XP_018290799.1 hypothetical protein PHYBLDRAFT_158983 [Phycomyces blakesleeanus NRRL 1555(-)]
MGTATAALNSKLSHTTINATTSTSISSSPIHHHIGNGSDHDIHGYEPTSPHSPHSPHVSVSYQQHRSTIPQRRSQQFYPTGPGQPLMMERAASTSSVTSSGNNVFDRLSQTPTRASRAKMAHRHSSGSLEDLRMHWDLERSSSSMSGSYYGD